MFVHVRDHQGVHTVITNGKLSSMIMVLSKSRDFCLVAPTLLLSWVLLLSPYDKSDGGCNPTSNNRFDPFWVDYIKMLEKQHKHALCNSNEGLGHLLFFGLCFLFFSLIPDPGPEIPGVEEGASDSLSSASQPGSTALLSFSDSGGWGSSSSSENGNWESSRCSGSLSPNPHLFSAFGKLKSCHPRNYYH